MKTLNLKDEDFEAGDDSNTYFHGPTIKILDTSFHTIALAVHDGKNRMQEAVDENLEEQYEALQKFYSGYYHTVTIRGVECVLIIHPFAD